MTREMHVTETAMCRTEAREAGAHRDVYSYIWFDMQTELSVHYRLLGGSSAALTFGDGSWSSLKTPNT